MITLVSPWESSASTIPDAPPSYCFVGSPKVSSLGRGSFASVTIIRSTRMLTQVLDGVDMIDLRVPVSVTLEQNNDGVSAENHALSIFAGGRNESEAIDDFQSTLLASWVGLKDAPEHDLTPDAHALRAKLSQHFLGA